MFAGNFAPVGWGLCNGQLLPISQNQTLYALIGTTYGGDGQSTFALPNLLGRIPVHQGTGGGGTYTMGESAGAEQITLVTNQLPAHTHELRASTADGTSADPTNAVWTASDARTFNSAAPTQPMHPSTLTAVGGAQPHPNVMPYLAITFIISLFGVFPSQN
ncbi:MAG: tail fiber protein [Myxococcales bacterium]